MQYSIGLVLIGVVVGSGIGLYALLTSTRPAGAVGPPQAFAIDTGDSGAQIAARLEQERLIESAALFQVMLKLKGADARIQAGEFQLHTGMSPDEIIAVITQPPAQAGVRVTIREGVRLGEIADQLQAADLIDRDHFMALAATSTFPYDFLPTRPLGGEVEGYLFPDTYFFPRHGADREATILNMLLTTFGQKLTPNRRQTIAASGRTIHQIVTIASIVEREAQLPRERATIAGVFYNRLRVGMPLQADPTAQYALGGPGNWWPVLRLDPHTVNSPYNTYTAEGLPPGPICSPGLAALDAAITPEANDYLFFVACGGGSHAFARTNDEHERNRASCGNK